MNKTIRVPYELDVFDELNNILVYGNGEISNEVLESVIKEIEEKDLKDKDLVTVTKTEDNLNDITVYGTFTEDMAVLSIKRLYKSGGGGSSALNS